MDKARAIENNKERNAYLVFCLLQGRYWGFYTIRISDDKLSHTLARPSSSKFSRVVAAAALSFTQRIYPEFAWNPTPCLLKLACTSNAASQHKTDLVRTYVRITNSIMRMTERWPKISAGASIDRALQHMPDGHGKVPGVNMAIGQSVLK